MFKIDKDIPLPAHGHGGNRHSKYPFAQMSVGDSFFAPATSKAVHAAATNFAKRNPGFKFTTRKEGDGTRIWRIASDATSEAV